MSVLESVLEVREEPRLVEELGGLQMTETVPDLILGQVGDGLEQSERHVCADDRGRLEETLLVGRESVDPRGQYGLHGRRHVYRPWRLRHTIGPAHR